jgi:hypothetical protein
MRPNFLSDIMTRVIWKNCLVLFGYVRGLFKRIIPDIRWILVGIPLVVHCVRRIQSIKDSTVCIRHCGVLIIKGLRIWGIFI